MSRQRPDEDRWPDATRMPPCIDLLRPHHEMCRGTRVIDFRLEIVNLN